MYARLGSRNTGAQIAWVPRYLGTWGWMALRNKKVSKRLKRDREEKKLSIWLYRGVSTNITPG